MDFNGSTLWDFSDMDFNGSVVPHSVIVIMMPSPVFESKSLKHFYTFIVYHMDLSFAIVIIGFGTVKNFFLLVSLILTYSSSCSFLQQKLGFIFPWSDIFHGSASEK